MLLAAAALRPFSLPNLQPIGTLCELLIRAVQHTSKLIRRVMDVLSLTQPHAGFHKKPQKKGKAMEDPGDDNGREARWARIALAATKQSLRRASSRSPQLPLRYAAWLGKVRCERANLLVGGSQCSGFSSAC